MNTFLSNLKTMNTLKTTENGALAYSTTQKAVYDMFALCAAYRSRSEEDCIKMFSAAYRENPELALKCLFYIRDIRGGQGERRFFRTCFRWLCQINPLAAHRNLIYIPEYGRWDDLIYSCMNTELEEEMLKLIAHQLVLDTECKTPSLLAKWIPSENASSIETKKCANKIRKYLKFSHKEYRKMLSILRKRINVLEALMSQNRWEEIEFDKIPSVAGLKYKNAFARRDIISKKYENFIKDDSTKVNAATLYPYDVVEQAIRASRYSLEDTKRIAVNKYWECLPNYLEGVTSKMICVCDTSGSMWGRPINSAIGLSMYCAERLSGPFKDTYISFSSKPQLIHIEGFDFCDKVRGIYETNLCSNTNLEATFDLMLNAALRSKTEDIPDVITVISDMEIDCMAGGFDWRSRTESPRWTKDTAVSHMEKIKAKWDAAGIKCPRLVYWNVNARNDTILDLSEDVSLMSGQSPILFKQILTGKTGWDLCLDVLLSDRYAKIN